MASPFRLHLQFDLRAPCVIILKQLRESPYKLYRLAMTSRQLLAVVIDLGGLKPAQDGPPATASNGKPWKSLELLN
jgi:hypothetical protein